MDQAWRLHLSNQSIQRVDILPADRPVLAVWTRRDRVAYYLMSTGTPLGDVTITLPPLDVRSGDGWRAFLDSLRGPSGVGLRQVQLNGAVLHLSADCKSYVLHQNEGTLHYRSGDSAEQRLLLKDAGALRALNLSADGQRLYALDAQSRLHRYVGGVHSGISDLKPSDDDSASITQLCIAHDAQVLYAAEERRVLRVSPEGKVLKRAAVPQVIQRMGCSADGRWLLTSDLDTGVIRLYDGLTLTQSHQRFSIDLLMEARQIQLIADLPPMTAAVSALAVSNTPEVVVAMSGGVCVAGTGAMLNVRSTTRNNPT